MRPNCQVVVKINMPSVPFTYTRTAKNRWRAQININRALIKLQKIKSWMSRYIILWPNLRSVMCRLQYKNKRSTVLIYRYFTLFLHVKGTLEWEITDFPRHSKGMRIYLWSIKCILYLDDTMLSLNTRMDLRAVRAGWLQRVCCFSCIL